MAGKIQIRKFQAMSLILEVRIMIHFIEIAQAGVITDAPTFQKIGTNILFFLLSIAEIIAMIALVVSGIRYFFSYGDEKSMQAAKQSAKYSIIGIVLAMGGMIVVRLVGQFMN